MEPQTLLVDFVPKFTKETPSQLRNKAYYEDLLATFDLGKVTVCTMTECRELCTTLDPDVIITAYSCDADEVKKIHPESVVYLATGVSGVFSRKAEIEEKKAKNIKIFKDAAETVQRIRDATSEEREQMRKYHAMSYDDTYKMIQQAIISDDEDLRKKAWDLLWGPGEKNSNIIWMRVQMMAEVWEGSKGKELEQLMVMSMERHLNQGTARKMDNFVDADGQKYHQYMFLDPYGNDLKHVRRLPFGESNQDRFAYENLLEKNEIPTNYLRVQVEANSLRKQWDDHLEEECAKIRKVLEEYEKDPNSTRKELGVSAYGKYSDTDALTIEEADHLRGFIEKFRRNRPPG